MTGSEGNQYNLKSIWPPVYYQWRQSALRRTYIIVLKTIFISWIEWNCHTLFTIQLLDTCLLSTFCNLSTKKLWVIFIRDIFKSGNKFLLSCFKYVSYCVIEMRVSFQFTCLSPMNISVFLWVKCNSLWLTQVLWNLISYSDVTCRIITCNTTCFQYFEYLRKISSSLTCEHFSYLPIKICPL